MLKFLTIFLLWSVVASAQDCGAYNSEDQSRPVSITFYSPEGECFDVTMQGVRVNPESATRVQFTVGYGLIPVVVKLANGNIIKKNLAIGDTYISANYKVVANKKGKYKLRFEPFTGTSTGPTADEMLAEMQAKQQAEQAARDKEWDDARAKEQQERDDRKAKEKAKEQAREDARDAEWAKEDQERKDRWAADSEKRRRENPGRQGATYDTDRQGRQGATYDTDRQGRQGATHTPRKGIGSSKYADAPPEEIAEIERDGKKYFDDYKDGHQIEFSINYKGEPACDWDVEIMLGDVVVAQGQTNSEGKFYSTYYGLLGTSFKVVGKRENMAWGAKGSWSVDGYWYLSEREYKTGKMDPMKVEVFEKYISDSMGINMSFAIYRMGSTCK
ncbi:MAG: hypothetical protein ACRBFS_16680 [Aureispira sp.]